MKKITKLLFCIFVIAFLTCATVGADGPEDKGLFEKILDKIISLYHKLFPEKNKTEIIVGKSIQPEEPKVVKTENEAPAVAQEIAQKIPSQAVAPQVVPPAEKSGELGIEKKGLKAEEKDESAAKKILLKSRQFVPYKGISPALRAKINKIDVADKKRIHVLMQLEGVADKEKKEELENQGVNLLAYIPNNAWYASIPADKADAVIADDFVRSMDAITTEDKISPYIREGKIGSWAIRNGFAALVVEFHEDVGLEEAEGIVKGLNGEVRSRIEILNALVVMVPKGMINKLAEDDAVQWIEEVSPAPKLELDQSRPMIGGDTVQAAPYNLNGSEVKVLVYDGGQIDDEHPDLTGRVTNAEIWIESDHTTHVAGIVGGNGTLSNGKLRGIAPAVTMIAYDNLDYWYNDTDASIIDPDSVETEYYEAINTYSVDIATNSWGYPAASDGYCEREGDYDIASELFDNIVRGSMGKKISVIFSGGNERGQGCGEFSTTNPPHAAKNIIAVGAVNSDDGSMTYFSSFGPVDDGRIKPDLVAPGCEAEGIGGRGINSTIAGWIVTGGYGTMCGTSMSAPHVTGSVALMIQQFRATYGYDPLPSTIKALLIHAADEYSSFPAYPYVDYASGYGFINITRAIDILKYESPVEIQTHYLLTGENDTYYINSSGLSKIKATLVWDDPAGQPFAAKELVNDLDLVLIDPSGIEHYPWKLDPANPSNAATTGVDDLNNVEQVYVSSPADGIWKIVVKGASVAVGIQSYSLVSEALLNQTTPPSPPTGPLTIVNMQHSAKSITKVRTVQRFSQLSSLNKQNEGNSTLKVRIVQRFSQLSILNKQNEGNSTMKIRIFSRPVIDEIPDQNLTEDSGLNDNLIDLWFYAYDNETADSSLNYTITLQTNAPVVNCSIDSNRYVDCTTQANQSGYSDITVQVANPGGLTDNDTFRVNITEINDIPAANITSPSNGSSFEQGTLITFTGTGTDIEDGSLTGSALQWYSDIDGNFGSGETLAISTLSVGYHLITLNVTDSGSLSGIDTININISTTSKTPSDDLILNSDTTLAPGTYNIPDANNDGVIIINASNIVLNCNGAEIIGSGSGYGIVGSGGIDMQHWMDVTGDLNGDMSPIVNNMSGFISSINFTENVIIKNCKISNYEAGINLTAFKNLELYDNELYNNGNGISYFINYLSNIHNNRIYGNKNGVYSLGIEENSIHHNDVYNNGIGITAVGYYDRIFNNNASGNQQDGIMAIWSNGTEIFNNTANNNDKGISLAEMGDVKVYGNIANYNGAGIKLSGLFSQGTSRLINISNNTAMYNSRVGIVLNDDTLPKLIEMMAGGASSQGHHIADSYVTDNNLYNTGDAYDFGIIDGTGDHVYNNTIIRNNFNGRGVYDVYAGNNAYCVDEVGNYYAENASIAPGDC